MNKVTDFAQKFSNPQFEGVYDIDPSELHQKMKNVKLIDVRQPDEFTGELGHIPGAELIVLDTLPEHLDKIPQDQTVVFVCRSGGRSARAAAFAQQNGYPHVYNMRGGMLLWNELQFPTEK